MLKVIKDYQPMPPPPIQPLPSRAGSRHGIADPLVAQVPPMPQPQGEEKPASRNYGDNSVFLSIGLFVFTLLFFLTKYLKGRKKPVSPAQFTRFGQQTSCSKCRFFNRNPYLKCAVHPENFDRMDAKDCPDFWSVDQDEFLKK